MSVTLSILTLFFPSLHFENKLNTTEKGLELKQKVSDPTIKQQDSFVLFFYFGFDFANH